MENIKEDKSSDKRLNVGPTPLNPNYSLVENIREETHRMVYMRLRASIFGIDTIRVEVPTTVKVIVMQVGLWRKRSHCQNMEVVVVVTKEREEEQRIDSHKVNWDTPQQSLLGFEVEDTSNTFWLVKERVSVVKIGKVYKITNYTFCYLILTMQTVVVDNEEVRVNTVVVKVLLLLSISTIIEEKVEGLNSTERNV